MSVLAVWELEDPIGIPPRFALVYEAPDAWRLPPAPCRRATYHRTPAPVRVTKVADPDAYMAAKLHRT